MSIPHARLIAVFINELNSEHHQTVIIS